MNDATPPADELFVTQFLVVSDQDRSRDFYRSVFGAEVLRDRDPVILALANTRIVLNLGGGPTDDKPTVTLAPPADPDLSSGFLNLRVRDIAQAYGTGRPGAPRSSPSRRTTGTRSAPTSAIRTVISSR
jgi:catechol 2,3-dioxygenase-like lactoylglutathione lyase family enzyme